MISTELLTFAFSENNIIEVTVEGNGTYEYRIDDGPWQTGTRFENVTIGEHRLFVRDLYNCNSLSDKKVVIGYNKFFTPNGDGYHDTWNIIGIEGRNNVKTYIFDRYGKLLKLINSSENGWDGTHGGVLMPTGDYWFKLEFLEPKTNMLKEFSSHFTLKR
jgi:gliding motility-associated-like protein